MKEREELMKVLVDLMASGKVRALPYFSIRVTYSDRS